MRLLYLTPTAAMGGAERVLLDLLALMRRARPSWPIALVVGNDGPLVADAARLGVKTYALPFPRNFAQLGDAGLASPASWAHFARHALSGGMATVRYLRDLRAVVSSCAPDVVHSNGIKMHLLGALAKPAGAALVWHFHDYPSGRPVTARLVRALQHRCDSVVAVSDSVAADIRRHVSRSMDVRTIWNSVDLERFTPEGPRLDLDALSGLPALSPDVLRIGLVATFARWKGHIVFLDMLRTLAHTHTFRAYVIGGPVYETHASQLSMDELRAAVAERGLTDLVGLTGFVTDTPAAQRALDVVVHASTLPEPFGLVIAEAMATARAVVISDAGGVAEIVSAGQTGLSYPCGSIEHLTSRVRCLLDDPPLRAQLGHAAHAAAIEQFNPNRIVGQMLGLYGNLVRSSAEAA